jgi:hypothetical protein
VSRATRAAGSPENSLPATERRNPIRAVRLIPPVVAFTLPCHPGPRIAPGSWSQNQETHEERKCICVWVYQFEAGFLVVQFHSPHRIPLLEPLFVILAGAGWYWIGEHWSPPGVAEI